MLNRRVLHLSISLAFVTLLVSPQMYAQELSPAQREVWQFIEACNVQYANENTEGILNCFHDDFSGWLYGDTVPRTKSSIEKFLPLDIESTEPLAFDLRPISIRVFGDFAVAHYFSASAYRDVDGEIVRERRIWTDVLLRENGSWSWVADHGGVVTPDQP